MSQIQNGQEMDQPYGSGGSVRRARERAEAGLPRETTEYDPAYSPPRRPVGSPSSAGNRPQAPAGLQTKEGNIGMAISRPAPAAPQWPLPADIITPPLSGGPEPYRPPPGKSQPPQRPPRPGKVDSMLDASRIREHMPVFQYQPQNQRVSELSVPETPVSSVSRPSTLSSVGSIPDFPLPTAGPPPSLPQSRRSLNLGPPPSSRRGASSFYSTISYVSPIPEESPRSRSHASYASSAAIPESFGTLSPGGSDDGNYFDDTIAEESIYSDDAEDRGLVRSASIGRKGKPSLVTTRSSGPGETVPIVLQPRDQEMPMNRSPMERSPIDQEPMDRPAPRPVQREPFPDGTSFLDVSSSSSATRSSKTPTRDTMLGAVEAASVTDPTSVKKATASPSPFARLSALALRRPPRLDIDAVRAAEARGSLTSLPDLIKRATRLASMIDKGRRPASHFDDLDFPEELYGRDPEKSYDVEKHQSGLSDMLAAFPPPGQANNRRSVRQSMGSWPLPMSMGNRRSFRGPPIATERESDDSPSPQRGEKKGRRCCGLPLWGFILLMVILLILIAAAIVIPLEFFVIRKQQNVSNGNAQSDLSSCQQQVKCENGGTNIITDGICSCICTNGFTGANCTISSLQGCTTATFNSADSTLTNVTVGESIPRLITEAQSSFNIAIAAQRILAKFNVASLSCTSENALVTFNGQSMRPGAANVAEVADNGLVRGAAVKAEADTSLTISVPADVDITLTLENPVATNQVYLTTLSSWTTIMPNVGATVMQTTVTQTLTADPKTVTESPSTTLAPASTATSSSASPTSTFAVTDDVLDFARVAVLFILQEQTLNDASSAQTSLSSFFSTTGSTIDSAKNVAVGGSNSVDLVNFTVDIGTQKVGKSS